MKHRANVEGVLKSSLKIEMININSIHTAAVT